MNIQDGYAICYPQIKHPLLLEKDNLKQEYITLVKYYTDKYCVDDKLALFRLKTFSMALFGTTDLSNVFLPGENVSKLSRAITKTRFIPFRLYSYRYLLLFDCLLIIASEDENIGMKICNDLKSTINKRYHNTMDTMLSQMYKGDAAFAINKLITDEMVEEWNRIRSFINSLNRILTFTATMSAGKSTLINAIIGKELSYAKMAACTSTIIKFLTSPSRGSLCNIFYGEQMKQFQGAGDIREFTKGRKEPCCVNTFFISPLSSRKITLIDTPGVNSSQNLEHRKITRTELTSASTDILVYVIPVENYGSEGDFEHLSFIRKNVNYNSIIFVVNMMDSCDLEDDSVDEIVNNIEEHLIAIGFEKPIVCPMSAKAGMLIKQAMFGTELSDNDKKACSAYVGLFLNDGLKLGSLYPPVEKLSIRNDIGWLENTPDEVWSAFINTGIPGFEKLILNLDKEDKECWT